MNKINTEHTPQRSRSLSSDSLPRSIRNQQLDSPRTPIRSLFPVTSSIPILSLRELPSGSGDPLPAELPSGSGEPLPAELPSGSGDPLPAELPSGSNDLVRNYLDAEPPKLRKAKEIREELLATLSVRLKNKIKLIVRDELIKELEFSSSQQIEALGLLCEMTDLDSHDLIKSFGFKLEHFERVKETLDMVKYLDLSDFDSFPLDSMEKRLMVRIHNKCVQIFQFVKTKDIDKQEIYSKDSLAIKKICNDFIKANDWAKGTISIAVNATLIPNQLPPLPDPFIGLE